jgi:hypothetical protein
MPFALIIIGLLMVITGARGTYAEFGKTIAGEFQGQNNFVYWFGAIIIVGSIGYVQELRTISRLLLALVIIVLILSHKGFFQQFQSALKTGPVQPNALPGQNSVSPNASQATINSAITSNSQGVGGSTPATAGQAKFNSWMNYIFGLGTNSAGATQ